MPLTQLSTLVLPAPFGPISANSSPASTANDTRSSTVRPPKRSVRPSIARSAIPPPATAILLDVAVAASLAAGMTQIELLDIRVAAQPIGVAIEDDPAVLHHVAVVGDLQRHGRALLDDQDGDAELAPNLGEAAQQVLHHDRRQAERQLVDQQQFGPAHDGAAERQHLPLAAGEEAADPALEIAELRKELIDQRLASAALGVGDAARNRRDQVLCHREIGKHLVAFGNQYDAAPGVLVRQAVLDALALERDRPFGDARVVDAEETGDRPQGCALAGAVGAEQRDDLSGLDRERDALHRCDRALVDDLELVDGEQGHRRPPATGR